MRKRICIISYLPIQHDARVLRQIEYLSPHFDLIVVGYGEKPQISGIEWHLFPARDPLSSKLIRNSLQVLGRINSVSYDLLELSRERYWKTLRALKAPIHAVLANDLSALAVAAEISRRFQAKLVFDAHEYSPLEQMTNKFLQLETPNRIYLLRKYAAQIDASMSVCQPIADRYSQEFGFHPTVILNAPKIEEVPNFDHAVSDDRIRLVSHGGLQVERKIEGMIRALALSDRRFELHLILIGDADYIGKLQRMSEEIAPHRVYFHEPVLASDVVRRIAEYDLGIFILPPTTYGFSVAMPNKFFDFIAAGLGVIIGPTPTMAQIVKTYDFGRVAPSFEPEVVAATLNELTIQQIISLREHARAAAQVINADVEMQKVISLFHRLLDDEG